MSRVELFERIRRDHQAEGLSVHELSHRYRVHRRTVRQALASAIPPSRKTPVRAAPALGRHEATVRRWLEEDRSAPRKQRHTARRVWQRLVAERGADVGESTVRRLVARLRTELDPDGDREVTIVQEHAPGEEAEVDFGEFGAWIGEELARLWLFHLRLSCSGRSFARGYAHQAQEAFFDGHVRAFSWLGGVPGRLRYDNLKPAVVRLLRGRDRVENERFVALRSHYGFDSFFCQPGQQGAHEKGGVEGEVGRFRRRHLVPVPRFASLAELNRFLVEAAAADDERVIAGRRETVGAAYAAEWAALRPLPAEPFDPCRLLSCKVDAKARICVLQAYYSVPARLAGRRVPVRLGADHLEVLAPGSDAVVATHERSLHKGTQTLVLDHYLEVLARKPGGLPGATALAQARATGRFTALHEEFWERARRDHGDADGTRALIEVLLLHRRVAACHVWAGLRSALKVGSTDPAVVAIEARRHADGFGDGPDYQPRLAAVIPLARPLPGAERPAPSLEGYDRLLAGREHGPSEETRA